MSSRSPSSIHQHNNNILGENQELIERNRNLELKLRYVQSVNTIFRQRVGVLVQALTTKLAEIQQHNNNNGSIINSSNISLSSLLNTVNDSTTLMQYQQHVDVYNNNNNHIDHHDAAFTPSPNSEVAYWQDRFIDAMSNIQPISQGEVETLCRLIREKVDRDSLISQQESQIRHLQQQNQQYRSPSNNNTNNNNTASIPRGNSQNNNNNNSVISYADEVAEEVSILRQQLSNSEARCKSLQFRLGEIRRKEQDSATQKSTQNLDLTNEVGNLMGTVRELRARLAEQESLNRRLTTEVDGLRSDKNLQLQHLNRMQGMCAAVMRESQCAVNEGLAATQMNETALLKRQLDTFELVLRKTEQELTQSKKSLEEKDAQLMEKEREVQALQLRLESKEKTMDLYRQRCERMATQEKEQREDHVNAMNLLKSRLGDAVGELQGAYTTKEIGEGLQKMTTSAEKISALSTQLTDMQKKYSTLRSCFAALSEELTLSSKQGRVPNLETVTSEEARILITRDDSAASASADSNNNNVIIKVPREKVLRVEGNWREVRDLNEGSVFYVSTSIVGTPFDPIAKEVRSADAVAAQQKKAPPSPSPQPAVTSSSHPESPTTSSTAKNENTENNDETKTGDENTKKEDEQQQQEKENETKKEKDDDEEKRENSPTVESEKEGEQKEEEEKKNGDETQVEKASEEEEGKPSGDEQ